MNKIENKSKSKHISVLKWEILRNCEVRSGMVVVDATLGAGGHFFEVVDKIRKSKVQDATVIGIDQDSAAIDKIKTRLDKKYTKGCQDDRYTEYTNDNIRIWLVRENFERLKEIFKKINKKNADYIFADLGISQNQVEDLDRGFSFKKDAPLDMRMNKELGVTAADLLNGLQGKQLEQLFAEYADMGSKGKKLANIIVEKRAEKLIATTNQLVSIIRQVVPVRQTSSHTGTKLSNRRSRPEARVFQALRIAVNLELDSLKQFLPQAFDTLMALGRLAVISFHSGEDRIVKYFFIDKVKGKEGRFVEKLQQPTFREKKANPRSSSAKLRVIKKLK